MLTPLQKMKLLLNIDSTDTNKDNLLQYLYDTAAKDYAELTNQPNTNGVQDLIIRMAIVRYNLIGSEGLASSNVSGLQETFQGYGADLIKSINAHRRVKSV